MLDTVKLSKGKIEIVGVFTDYEQSRGLAYGEVAQKVIDLLGNYELRLRWHGAAVICHARAGRDRGPLAAALALVDTAQTAGPALFRLCDSSRSDEVLRVRSACLLL
jgi:hypothetical protein